MYSNAMYKRTDADQSPLWDIKKRNWLEKNEIKIDDVSYNLIQYRNRQKNIEFDYKKRRKFYLPNIVRKIQYLFIFLELTNFTRS